MDAAPTIALRPAIDEDRAVLLEVYASTRREELAPLGWTQLDEDAFLRQQFDAQDAYYREHYLGASFDVIELDGRPIGRLYVARWDDEIRVVDIALLPGFRGRGIGGELLSSLFREADERGVRISIHVERFNPAMAWYERLGFAQTQDRGVYVLMEREPRGARGIARQPGSGARGAA